MKYEERLKKVTEELRAEAASAMNGWLKRAGGVYAEEPPIEASEIVVGNLGTPRQPNLWGACVGRQDLVGFGADATDGGPVEALLRLICWAEEDEPAN